MITLKELKSKIDKNARLIGLDLGKKRIGVSICDHKRIIATPFKTIEYVDHESFITELLEIINQENIEELWEYIKIDILAEAANALWDKNSNYKIKSLKDNQILMTIDYLNK